MKINKKSQNDTKHLTIYGIEDQGNQKEKESIKKRLGIYSKNIDEYIENKKAEKKMESIGFKKVPEDLRANFFEDSWNLYLEVKGEQLKVIQNTFSNEVEGVEAILHRECNGALESGLLFRNDLMDLKIILEKEKEEINILISIKKNQEEYIELNELIELNEGLNEGLKGENEEKVYSQKKNKKEKLIRVLKTRDGKGLLKKMKSGVYKIKLLGKEIKLRL